MAVGTTAAILGSIGAAKGIVQTIQGAKQKADAMEALENYPRQDLINPAENLRISTLGAEIAREELARNQANVTDIVAQGGARSIIGAMGRIQIANNEAAQRIGANLDEQMLNREYAVMEGEYNRMAMQERREEADLAGIGQQLMVGNQDMWSGFGDVAQAGMFLANNSIRSEGDTGELSDVNTYDRDDYGTFRKDVLSHANPDMGQYSLVKPT